MNSEVRMLLEHRQKKDGQEDVELSEVFQVISIRTRYPARAKTVVRKFHFTRFLPKIRAKKSGIMD